MNMETVMNTAKEGGLEDVDTNFPRSPSPSPPRLEVQDELETFPNNDDEEESSGNEETENLFQPMSEEQFTSLYQHYRNKEDWDFTNNKEFKGFSDEKRNLLMTFYDKKSEILFDFYRNCISKAFDAKFEKGKGLVPFEVNGVKAVLINKKIYDQIRNSAKRVKKRPAHTVVKESSKVNAGNISSSIGMMTPPPLTSRPLSGPRVIQTPKRYLDGELIQQPKKRQFSGRNPVSKDKNIFQIGLLPPKYPKQIEQSPGIAETKSVDKASLKKRARKRLCDTSGGFGPFEITHLLQSGELDLTTLVHQLEEISLQQKFPREEESSTHRQIMETQEKRLEKLRLEEDRVDIERLSNTVSNFPDMPKTSGCERKPCSLKNAKRCMRCCKPTSSDALETSGFNTYLCSICMTVLGIDPSNGQVIPSKKSVVKKTEPPPLIPVTAFSSGISASMSKLKKCVYAHQKTNFQQAMKRDRDIRPVPPLPKIKHGTYGRIPIPKIPVLTGRTFKKRNNLPLSLRLPPQLSKPRMPRVPSIDQSVHQRMNTPNNRERILQKTNEGTQIPPPPPLKIFPQQMNAVHYGDEAWF